MQQLSIDYFWPLTEQIPLALDYTDCAKPQLTYSIDNAIGGGFTFNVNDAWSTTSITTSRLHLDVDTTVIKTNTKPPLIRRGLYKLLGLKWEIK
jgi:GH18 family chitinase